MAGELNPNAEVGKSVLQAINSGADSQALADVLKEAYPKVKPTVEEALASARGRSKIAKEVYGIDSIKPQEVTKATIEKPKKEKADDKAAEKAAKAVAKSKKKDKKLKKSPNELIKAQKEVTDKSAKNDKELAKLKEKEEKKNKKGEKGQDGKRADGQEMDKLVKPDLSKYGIKESGKDYIMPITDGNGKTVNVKVTDEVNQLKGICSKIDDANKVIEQHNQAAGKPNISVDPNAVAGKNINTPDSPAVVAPTIATFTPEMADTVKKETCAAALAGVEFKDIEGKSVQLNEEQLKSLAEAALAIHKGDKLTKGLDEKKKEEEKTDHGEKPKSLATPTMQVGGRGM